MKTIITFGPKFLIVSLSLLHNRFMKNLLKNLSIHEESFELDSELLWLLIILAYNN